MAKDKGLEFDNKTKADFVKGVDAQGNKIYGQSILNNVDDAIANKNKFYIEIYPIHAQGGSSSKESVKFKAFLTQFDDQFQANFAGEDVFGRMDPIQVYKGTTRSISLSWDVPSMNEKEAKSNLQKCSDLMTMLYPVYQKLGPSDGQGRVMTAPPLFRIKFANLITNAAVLGGATGAPAKEAGLFGTINGFSYSPDLDSGFLTSEDGDLLPQTISLGCQFTVVHDHELGWDQNGNKAQPNFPYGAVEQEEDRNQAIAQNPTSQREAEQQAGDELAITAGTVGKES